MRIIGHGVDIVEVKRIAEMVERHADHFLDRVFTAGENSYAASSPRRRAEHLAGRFAAKEAALKALGTGWRSGIAWTDVEVRLEPSGRPNLVLHGAAESAALASGITAWHVSISHTDDLAIASVIGEG